MNYYEHHIGDYDKSTAHLTACEDGIYCRMLRLYYDREAPLPLDLKALQRLVRARTREEKSAVATLATEFFSSESDGLHHARCDAEIARYQDKRNKARRSAEARWGTHEDDANAMRTHEKFDANASDPHDKRNAHQSPVTSHQSSIGKVEASTAPPIPTETGRACLLMKQAGCGHTNPGHVDLVAAIAEGVAPETLRDTVIEAVGKGIGKPFTWAIATARARHAAGPAPVMTAKARAGPSQSEGKTMTAIRVLEGMKSGNDQERNRLDQGRISHGVSEVDDPRLGRSTGG